MKRIVVISILAGNIAYTHAFSCTDISNNLSKGSRSPSVLLLQNFLYEKGLLQAKPNGYFGNGTYKAVIAYQRSINLSKSGKVFPLTRTAIKNETCTDTNNETDGTTSNTPQQDETPLSSQTQPPAISAQKNTFTDTVSYKTLSGKEETIHVTVTLSNDTISNIKFTHDIPMSMTSSRYLDDFEASLDTPSLIGKKIGDISLSRIGGASLTTNAFMQALDHIAHK
jgi:hypothetical protein